MLGKLEGEKLQYQMKTEEFLHARISRYFFMYMSRIFSSFFRGIDMKGFSLKGFCDAISPTFGGFCTNKTWRS